MMTELVEREGVRFLKARFFGTVSIDEIERARTEVVRVCNNTETACILVDLREAALDLSRADALTVADSGASIVPKHMRIAVVKKEGQPGHDTILNLYGHAAQNRARDVQVFGDMGTAEQWLLR